MAAAAIVVVPCGSYDAMPCADALREIARVEGTPVDVATGDRAFAMDCFVSFGAAIVYLVDEALCDYGRACSHEFVVDLSRDGVSVFAQLRFIYCAITG